MKNYPEIARAYAEDVLSGTVDACKYVKQACKRHLDDLNRQGDEDFPYWFDDRYEFDEDKSPKGFASKVCYLIEQMPCTKGEWANRGENIELQPWQVFITCCVFGWRRGDVRRFSIAYIEVPRGNGKSEWSAALGLYMLRFDGEFGAEVYCGATTEKQAKIVFTAAKEMVRRTPGLKEKYGLGVHASNIAVPGKNSKFEPVIGKPGDGDAPSFAIVDEFHEHQSDELYDTMHNGMVKRQQGIMWVITTAGIDTAGPCYALRSDVIKMLAGALPVDKLFGLIYTIDEGDSWEAESSLKKANPSYGMTVNAEELRGKAQMAVLSAYKQNDFKTKHLNVWTGSKSSWLNMEFWNRCGDSLNESMFQDELCWMGVDLSQTNDFTSVAIIYRREVHYYLFTKHYMTEAQVNDPAHTHYQGWAHDEHISVISGNAIDYDIVVNDILEANRRIVALGYDRRFAHQFAVDLVGHGINAVEVPQTYAIITEPMTLLDKMIKDGVLHHDNNPATNWMMGNVVVREWTRGSKTGMMPAKERRENKIDAASAAINALVMATAQKEEETMSGTHLMVL